MKIEHLQGRNVFAFAAARTGHAFTSIARVHAYWEGLRNGRSMPTRRDIDPRGISDVLEHSFVLDGIAPGLARIRLAGMHLNDLMDMEVRGMPITALFLPEARRDMQDVLKTVLERPATVKLTLESDFGLTRPRLAAQMILMPLKDENGRATRIFGALQAKGHIGRGPRRFRVLSNEVGPTLDRPLPIEDWNASESVASQMVDKGDTGRAAAKPYLRLVHNTT